MKKFKMTSLFTMIAAAFLATQSAEACTNIQVKAKDGTVLLLGAAWNLVNPLIQIYEVQHRVVSLVQKHLMANLAFPGLQNTVMLLSMV